MYKKYILSFIIIINLSAISFSQNTLRNEYIQKYQNLAIKEMVRSGIPASITMAQACLESGDGKSKLALLSNNHFGIKCKSSWNGKKVYYDDDEKNECFRSYRTVKQSFIDHSDFLMDNARYASLFKLKHTNYKAWAKGLKKAGYATAKHYDSKLIEIIERYDLHKLDRKRTIKKIKTIEPPIANKSKTKSNLITPFQTRDVELRNGIKSIVIRKGDSFKSIAQEFALEVWEIYYYNNYNKNYHLQPNEITYIEAKKRRASKNKLTHTISKGESMHYISQMYGIKLRPLYKRNRMKFNEQPQLGQVIYLRKKKKLK